MKLMPSFVFWKCGFFSENHFFQFKPKVRSVPDCPFCNNFGMIKESGASQYPQWNFWNSGDAISSCKGEQDDKFIFIADLSGNRISDFQ